MTQHRTSSASASMLTCITFGKGFVSQSFPERETPTLSVDKFSGVTHPTTEAEEEDYYAEMYLALA